jgi:hypothetical protein
MCRSTGCCTDRKVIGMAGVLLACSLALPVANAQAPQVPQNHGVALSAGCEATTCVGDSLLCSVDVTRNDACGDAIVLHSAHAHIGPEDPNAPEIPLTILAVSGNTNAVPGPFTGDILLGAPGDTFGGLPGDPGEPVVTLGLVAGDYIVQPTDPDPSLITFHIFWEDTCDDFNHTPDCTDCPGGITFQATTGAVFHPSPIPNCCIAGPGLICPGPHGITYTVTECSDPPLTDVTFAWTISGDALFCDGSDTATGDTVCVDAFLVCPGSFTLDVTVTTADGCSNTCSFTVEINDTTPPVLTGCPDDASFQCLADVPPPADVTAEDDCDGPVDVVFTETQSNPGSNCNNIITRTWTATDFCGNEASCTQIITVNDDTAPVLTGCPDGGTFQCFADVPPPADVTAEDNCDGPLPVDFFEDQSNPGSNCDNIIVRTWTATDSCGNPATCSATYFVNDDTPPVLTGCPGDANFQCLADVPPPANVTAEDNCDGPLPVDFFEDQSNPGSNCDNVITRTWTAMDSCGNVASCTQIITVNDDTPPVLTGCPDGGTLECNVPFEFTVTAEDNCDGPVDAVCEMTANDPPGSATFEDLGGGSYRLTFTADGTATITCTATDGCGNVATCTNDFSATCAVGCTLTWGYWKTHGIPDCGNSANPHPDDTWLLLPGGLGTDTIFYLSDQTYCEVMLTAPKGNSYYSLAHQFIAAQLNQLAGASIPPDVLDAYNEALMLFETYTPDDVKNSFDLKAQFNALVGILDDYNSGLIGPGHCAEETLPPANVKPGSAAAF